MMVYDGKTLDEWRACDPATWPARVQKAVQNSDRLRLADPYAYERAQLERELRGKRAAEAGVSEADADDMPSLPPLPPVQAWSEDQRETIEREGTAFLRRWCDEDEAGNLVVTDQVLTQLTMVALKCLHFHAIRGDLRAAEIIVNKCVPEPKQTLDVRVQSMSREEVEAEKARILAGLAPGVRAALQARLARGVEDGEGEE
jgi:hypothetical protein